MLNDPLKSRRQIVFYYALSLCVVLALMLAVSALRSKPVEVTITVDSDRAKPQPIAPVPVTCELPVADRDIETAGDPVPNAYADKVRLGPHNEVCGPRERGHIARCWHCADLGREIDGLKLSQRFVVFTFQVGDARAGNQQSGREHANSHSRSDKRRLGMKLQESHRFNVN